MPATFAYRAIESAQPVSLFQNMHVATLAAWVLWALHSGPLQCMRCKQILWAHPVLKSSSFILCLTA